MLSRSIVESSIEAGVPGQTTWRLRADARSRRGGGRPARSEGDQDIGAIREVANLQEQRIGFGDARLVCGIELMRRHAIPEQKISAGGVAATRGPDQAVDVGK